MFIFYFFKHAPLSAVQKWIFFFLFTFLNYNFFERTPKQGLQNHEAKHNLKQRTLGIYICMIAPRKLSM
jgi:hypothetical protein